MASTSHPPCNRQFSSMRQKGSLSGKGAPISLYGKYEGGLSFVRAAKPKILKRNYRLQVAAYAERSIESMELYFAEGKEGNKGVSVMDYVRGDQARFFCPIPREPNQAPGAKLHEDKPYMLFLPGIDSTGMNAVQQFPELLEKYDLRCLGIPADDRTPFLELCKVVESFLNEELRDSPPDRPVYLMGESFGSVLALAVAHRNPDLVHRLVLVNPATSFPRSVWPSLGPLLTDIPAPIYDQMLPLVLSPLVSDPLAIAQGGVVRDSDPLTRIRQLADSLQVMLPTVAILSRVLPKETLMWKLKLIQEGNTYLTPRLTDIFQRVLLVCGEDDRLIPSGAEAERLAGRLARCSTKVLERRGHTLLMEDGIHITQIIEEMGFYISKRVVSGMPLPGGKQGARGGVSGATRRRRVGGGVAGPAEVPTPREIELASAGLISNLELLTSPVFFSTSSQGRVSQGLASMPCATPGRPLIFVGNHQTFGLPDNFLFIKQMLTDRNTLVRGLAHPFAFQPTRRPGSEEPPKEAPGGLNFLTSYGAVPVSPRNMYQLLRNGETMLVFPGGTREAFKYRGEEYKLIWPNKPEIIRMAAKFNATIVPLSAIGIDDTVNIALDGKELAKVPILGPWLSDNAKKIPKQARNGTNVTSEVEDTWMVPIPAFPPKLPGRIYFLAGKPIQTSREEMNDSVVVQAKYDELKTKVEGGIQYLLKKRNEDPYNGFLQRTMYEAPLEWKRKAPTFDP